MRCCYSDRMRRFAVLLALSIVPDVALAQVTQPNGLVVPVDSANGETQLYSFFTNRGEAIDWIADASREPDTFSPLCEFTAEFVLNEAGNHLGVGWYNVIPGATTAPSPSDIYEIIPAGAAVGTTATGASIRADSRYLGGEIGFALIRTPPHFTESRWNTVCDSGDCAGSPGPWVLSLSYRSTTVENAWYIAFEDGDTSSSSWNNDGDYNDDVFFFTGIACAGAGQPCTVPGEMGVCANGLSECASGGELTCRRVNDPSAELCNGVDDDCDGSVDGDGLCGAGEVCSRGRCVRACDVEFGCAAGTECEDGYCVDEACVGVTCDAGRACVAGSCVAPCDGVTCPGDQVCRAGACVDPCLGVTCEAPNVCEGGVCVTGCSCRACGAGRECAGDGHCVDAGCAGVSCDAGMVCRAGACVDACEGAVCPPGQECSQGACVDLPSGTVDAGTTVDGGGTIRDGGGFDGGSGRPDGVAGGCGCRAGESRGSSAPMLGLLSLLFALALVRSRRG